MNFMNYSRTKIAHSEGILLEFFINQNFSFCTEFSKIRHSILWEFLLFKFPKEIKDAKRNISMHYKTSLNIIRLDLLSYYNMDGRHKMTGTIKKGVWKHQSVHSLFR